MQKDDVALLNICVKDAAAKMEEQLMRCQIAHWAQREGVKQQTDGLYDASLHQYGSLTFDCAAASEKFIYLQT